MELVAFSLRINRLCTDEKRVTMITPTALWVFHSCYPPVAVYENVGMKIKCVDLRECPGQHLTQGNVKNHKRLQLQFLFLCNEKNTFTL